ncbi:MAG: GntR family transcriptional regulator [Pseudomonadota bacterium]
MTPYLPLYAQVRETLIKRISAREWAPGTALPSETALAAELGVSQGTVRKALDSLCADGALTRAQGRGTFVAEQTVERANFRFFRLTDESGAQVFPELLSQDLSRGTATAEEAGALSLAVQAPVHRIDRVRTVGGMPLIHEHITLPVRLFPRLGQGTLPPNALYPFYQQSFGISVLRTEDRLTADPATDVLAQRLHVARGAPLLTSTRVAYDLTDRSVELRISAFVTEGHGFSVSLR